MKSGDVNIDYSKLTIETSEKIRINADYSNIKLDKTGGLSEAVHLLQKAKSLDFEIMVGCMVGSSLAMAPAYTLCAFADFVDLDGPLLVAKDRSSKFRFDNGTMSTIPASLWGMAASDLIDPELLQLSQS